MAIVPILLVVLLVLLGNRSAESEKARRAKMTPKEREQEDLETMTW